MSNRKRERRERAQKKAKIKRYAIIISSCVVLLAIIVTIIVTAVIAAKTLTFTDGFATVNLRPSGKFDAVLHHNERYSGSYTTTEAENGTLVNLFYSGVESTGFIAAGSYFVFPDEWVDDHGHEYALPIK